MLAARPDLGAAAQSGTTCRRRKTVTAASTPRTTVNASAGNSLLLAWKIAAPTMTSTSPAAARGANQEKRWRAGGTVRPKAAANSATPMNWRNVGGSTVRHRVEQAMQKENDREKSGAPKPMCSWA